MQKHIVTAILALSCLGCGESHKWESAKQQASIEAIRTFLTEYPNSTYTPEALAMIGDLERDADFLNFKMKLRAFLNGDEAHNVLKSFNGSEFEAREQPSGGLVIGGGNAEARSVLWGQSMVVITSTPAFGQFGDIKSALMSDGVSLEFNNGHSYVYSSFEWKRKG